ncbi:MAG TPA: type II toxin-antitoxin system RelE/ParE family toxin [Longimicrobium sp.]|nr:type II toxin-antitoxin system RelE/ParE family toxin [Longimicrobium sp.]
MKPGRYVLSPASLEDLRGIGRYYRGEAGRQVAANVVRGIRSACQLLADTPGEIGHARDELRPGVRSMPTPPHVVFFRYAGGIIEVVRILHERQDVAAEFDP